MCLFGNKNTIRESKIERKSFMRKTFKKILKWLNILGFRPDITFYTLTGLFWYYRDYKNLKIQKRDNKDFAINCWPILVDKHDQSGVMCGHYFHQDLYIARQIYKNNPKVHVDIGSRIDGFIAHVAAFRKIEVIDIREQNSCACNISFKQLNFMDLPPNMVNYCDSISSLHAIEHFGLGRYGDPINYNGHSNAIKNITQILVKGGKFYFSVPIGKQRIEFNAHRVFSVDYLLNILQVDYNIEGFSYVDDKGNFYERVDLHSENIKNNFNCSYGCGIFELVKK